MRSLENFECALILFSEFKVLIVLEVPKCVSKRLEFVNVDLSSLY